MPRPAKFDMVLSLVSRWVFASCLNDRRRSSRSALSQLLFFLTAASFVSPLEFAFSTVIEPTVDFARDIQPILTEKCLKCHSGEKPGGDLDLTDPRRVLSQDGTEKGIIVPGHLEKSLVWERVTTTDTEERMPPLAEPQLSKSEIEKLQAWIQSGATWSLHWSFRTLERPVQPNVEALVQQVYDSKSELGSLDLASWKSNAIDAFVLQSLHKNGLVPSPQAEPSVLVKRLHYDLIGLPPSLSVVESLNADPSFENYCRVVDELLNSPHFGERWGRHWLDLAHFADSDGFEKDRARPDAYLYRDWVIDSINRDQPYDEFTIEQLAGDLIPNATSRQRTATAFLRQTLTNEEGGVDQEEYRVAACFDRAETVGTVFLGLTVGCVRCHTHKYDPLPHADYYKLFAFFNNSDEATSTVVTSATKLEQLESQLGPLEAELEKRLASHAPDVLRWETEQRELVLAKKAGDKSVSAIEEKDIANALEMYPEKRIAATKEKLFEYYVTKVAEDKQIIDLREQIAALRKKSKAKTVQARTIKSPRLPRTTYVFHRGDFLSPGEPVKPATPQILGTFRARGDEPDRLDLAQWLVHRNNNLTPRVVANQIWQHLFGAGLVRTPGDFGARGEPPTHPELLDWIAETFRTDLKWSRKQLIRQIVTSATYRQSSMRRSDAEAMDPDNKLLFRQNRFRVESEILRDLNLAVSGLLSAKVGGPSVYPPMPEELAKLSYANSFDWKNSEGEDRYRRGMYTFFKRTIPHPNLVGFDSPDANTACVRRDVSNTPLQSLTLLNNEVHHEASQAFAARILSHESTTGPSDPQQLTQERLNFAFQLCTARKADPVELQELSRLLSRCRQTYSSDLAAAETLAKRFRPSSIESSEFAAWVATVRVLLNLDEFITRE